MLPEDNETTPLLHPPNTYAISSFEEQDTISSADHHEQHSHPRLTSSYRRPSFVAGGGRGLLLPAEPIPESELRDDEAFDCIREERGLLKSCSIDLPTSGGREGSSVAASVVADVEDTWDDAVKEGKIKTSWRYELGVMTRYAVSSCFESG